MSKRHNLYQYVVYADDDMGTGMVFPDELEEDSDKEYMGICMISETVAREALLPDDFLWTRVGANLITDGENDEDLDYDIVEESKELRRKKKEEKAQKAKQRKRKNGESDNEFDDEYENNFTDDYIIR